VARAATPPAAASTASAARGWVGGIRVIRLRWIGSAVGAIAATAGLRRRLQCGDTDGARSLERVPALGGRLVVRHQVARHSGDRAGAHVDSDLAVQVETLQIVEMRFRNDEGVTHEDHGRIQRGRKIGAAAQAGVGAECQRNLAAVADQRQARLIGNQGAPFELDGLLIAVRAARLESEPLELRGDVLHGLLKALGAHVAALKFVVGEELDVRPPQFALGGIIRGEKRSRGQEQKHRFFHGKALYRSSTGGRRVEQSCSLAGRAATSAISRVASPVPLRFNRGLLRRLSGAERYQYSD
jgi:hypothetical protein